jgi:hypothetical protein
VRERERELAMPDGGDPINVRLEGFVKRVGAEVGKLLAFEVTPEGFERVEDGSGHRCTLDPIRLRSFQTCPGRRPEVGRVGRWRGVRWRR